MPNERNAMYAYIIIIYAELCTHANLLVNVVNEKWSENIYERAKKMLQRIIYKFGLTALITC